MQNLEVSHEAKLNVESLATTGDSYEKNEEI